MKQIQLFILFFISYGLYAQLNIENININEYKLTDYKYKSLGLYFNFEGNGDVVSKNDFLGESNVGNFNNKLRLKSKFVAIKNSRKKQLSRYVSLNVNPGLHTKYVDEHSEINDFNFSNYLTYRQDVRYYLNSLIFFENGMNFLLSWDKTIKDSPKIESSFSSIYLRIPLYIGFGRVENVTSAWHAFRIIKGLKQSDLLINNSNLDKDEIMKMADYIAIRKNTRAFDSRRKMQDDLIGLSNNFLKNIVDISDPHVYASLYDMWQYGINDIRRSGTTLSFGIEPGFRYFSRYDKPNSNNDFDHKAIDLLAMVRFEYYRALSMNWQLDFGISLAGGFEDIIGINSDEEPRANSLLRSNLNIGVGYYPTSRTSFKSTLRVGAGIHGDSNGDRGNTNFNFNFNNNLYYYISPQLRLSLYLRMDNYTTIFSDDQYGYLLMTATYGLSFNYYIF